MDAEGVVVDPLDPVSLDEDSRLHIAQGVLEGPTSAHEVHVQTVARQAFLPPEKDHVSFGQDLPFAGAVGLRVRDDLEAVGLNARFPELEIYEARSLEVSLTETLLSIGGQTRFLRRAPHRPLFGGFRRRRTR